MYEDIGLNPTGDIPQELNSLRLRHFIGESYDVTILFWVLFIVLFVISAYRNYPSKSFDWIAYYVLIAILGVAEFGNPFK